MVLLFLPINSWRRDIQNLFHKSEMGDIDTFKFILFAFGGNMSPTIPTTAQRSYSHLAILKHHHNNNEHNKNNNNNNNNNDNNNNNNNNEYFFSPLKQKRHFMPQFCIQLSRILFFTNLFEQKLFKSSEDH